MFLHKQNIEFAIKGKFDAVLDTIGGPDTERIGITLLKRGGHYLTLQVGIGSLLVFFLNFAFIASRTLTCSVVGRGSVPHR